MESQNLSWVGFLVLYCKEGMRWPMMRKMSKWIWEDLVTRMGGRPAQKQSESCFLLPWPKSGCSGGFVLKFTVALVGSLQSSALPLCFSLLAICGLWSLLSLPFSPPHCWAIQIGRTCFFFGLTLCILTNQLPDTLEASLRLLAPLISMVTEGMVMLVLCLRELAWTSCYPGIACPFAVNGAAWGRGASPSRMTGSSRCGHLASLSSVSPGKYDVINRASAAGTIQHLTLIFHVSYLLSLF